MHRAAPLLGRSKLPFSLFNPTLPYLARGMLCWQLALCLQYFAEQGSFTSLKVQSFNILLANHNAVVSRVRLKAMKYTAVQGSSSGKCLEEWRKDT